MGRHWDHQIMQNIFRRRSITTRHLRERVFADRISRARDKRQSYQSQRGVLSILPHNRLDGFNPLMSIDHHATPQVYLVYHITTCYHLQGTGVSFKSSKDRAAINFPRSSLRGHYYCYYSYYNYSHYFITNGSTQVQSGYNRRSRFADTRRRNACGRRGAVFAPNSTGCEALPETPVLVEAHPLYPEIGRGAHGSGVLGEVHSRVFQVFHSLAFSGPFRYRSHVLRLLYCKAGHREGAGLSV